MPYKSDAQRRFFNSEEGREKIGEATVEEFNKASKGMDLPEKAKDDGLLMNQISPEERHRKYIEILKIAKAAENEAIKIPMVAMGYAPPEDLAQLAEVLNDENDHDAIYTDLLFKAVTGNPNGAMNTIYYPTDEMDAGIEHEDPWHKIKHLSKGITHALALGNTEEAAKLNIALNECMDTMVRDEAAEVMDGGPGSGNFGHRGRPGKHGGSIPKNRPVRNKRKKKEEEDK